PNRAPNAASTALARATAAAAAARTARDAANSAADHAESAADAAEEAVKYAGQAIDFANRSTAHAAQAVEAANTATKAVEDAVAVERAAREAELSRLEHEKLQAVDEARLLARLEAEQRAAYEDKRAQDERTNQAVKDVIARAEQALTANDLTQAAVLGRQAALGLLDSTGAWTRQAAQFALAGDDVDVLSWVDLDRALAQHQDDRETVLYLAQISTPAIARAAQAALESSSTTAVGDFVTGGVINASQEDNRFQIARILSAKPGKAVRKAADDALNADTPQALQAFFDRTYPAAVREDDAVRAAVLLNAAGAYTRAYAEVALEGPTWMRRNFVGVVQYTTAQLDHDAATHVAAIRAAIAAAAKIAQEAQADAALASQTAARARNAAAEAERWANNALDSANRADQYAVDAKRLADEADASALAAQASADQARTAAATARGAARSANYSANKAIDAARSALNSSYSAQASAVAARQASLTAGQDARAAADAASEARATAVLKRQAEDAEKARQAAEQSSKDRADGRNPADSQTHDQVNENGTGPKRENWWEDAGWYADAFNCISIGSGLLAGTLGLASLAFPPLALGAAFFGAVSAGTSALSALFTGIEHGFTSGPFLKSASNAALGLLSAGQSKWLKPLGQKVAAPVVKEVTHVGEELASSVTRKLSSIF
ncbi:hypothetical protein ACFWBX_22510, partial [Streptomyces sp. NPDC059991]